MPGQHYSTAQSYPKSATVTEYLNQLGVESDRVNRDAVIRFREGTTPEEIDLTIRPFKRLIQPCPTNSACALIPIPSPWVKNRVPTRSQLPSLLNVNGRDGRMSGQALLLEWLCPSPI